MTTIQVVLPDDLAEQAQKAGLLSDTRVESWLREELRRQQIDELFEAMHRMAALDDMPPMSPEEITEEIHAMRAEQRAKTPA